MERWWSRGRQRSAIIAVEGSTQTQALEITGFARADLRALYRPDWVALEGQDARRLMERQGSPEEFRSGLRSTIWDELQLAHHCGYVIWNYIATPFILADPDFETKVLPRNVARGESLRQLSAVFPARIVTHASTQTFHFEREGFLRRLDYPASHDDHTLIAQMFSGHQRFSGILVPTLCRLLSIGAEGLPVAKPSLAGRRNLRCPLRVKAAVAPCSGGDAVFAREGTNAFPRSLLT